MKVFDLAAPSNDKYGPDAPAINWHDGGLTGANDLSMQYGRVQTWTRDVTWGVKNNSGKKLHEAAAYTISGENGKSHEGNYEQTQSGYGRHIPMQFVKGFSITAQQNSTAGHGLYLKNAGIEFVLDDGTVKRWGSNNFPRSSSYGDIVYQFEFPESEQKLMAGNGARFHRFICRASTSGGSGTRTTTLTLGEFRLLYGDTGSSNNLWVMPSNRPYNKRKEPDVGGL